MAMFNSKLWHNQRVDLWLELWIRWHFFRLTSPTASSSKLSKSAKICHVYILHILYIYGLSYIYMHIDIYILLYHIILYYIKYDVISYIISYYTILYHIKLSHLKKKRLLHIPGRPSFQALDRFGTATRRNGRKAAGHRPFLGWLGDGDGADGADGPTIYKAYFLGLS